MTPKAQQPQEEGLLEFLEKAVGTNKYIEQIKEQAQRLEDLNARRVGFMERMQLSEREKDQLEALSKELLAAVAEKNALAAKMTACKTGKENIMPKKNKILSNLREGTSSRGKDKKQSITEERKLSLQIFIVNENCKRLKKLLDRKQEESRDRTRELDAAQSQFEKNDSGLKKALLQLEEFKHHQRAGASHSSRARNVLKRYAVQLSCQISQMLDQRVSDEDIQEAGLPYTFTSETLGEWLEGAGWDSVFIEPETEAEAAKRSETEEVPETAEGSASAAQCQVAEAEAEASKEDMQRLERLVAWLCGNRMIAEATNDEMQSKLQASAEELMALQGRVDMGCIGEYNKKEDVYLERFLEAADVTLERNAVKQEHDGLISRRQKEFTAGLDAIRMRVKEIFKTLAPGGDADLAPIDPLDPFSQGIRFSVRPPQQQCWRSVADLDGQEKTLSFLALLLAVHLCTPELPIIAV
ncbi:unnamed protein product [Closterium sp. Yama58-4]|nr:unnamed protein product [Closterium sp. Yama58-4]